MRPPIGAQMPRDLGELLDLMHRGVALLVGPTEIRSTVGTGLALQPVDALCTNSQHSSTVALNVATYIFARGLSALFPPPRQGPDIHDRVDVRARRAEKPELADSVQSRGRAARVLLAPARALAKLCSTHPLERVNKRSAAAPASSGSPPATERSYASPACS